MHNSTPIFRSDGKRVGFVVGEEFQKRVIKSKHMLRKPFAWSSDTDVLSCAFEAGARVVVLFEQEDNVEWRAPVALFWKKGFPIQRGHGPQRGLELKFWERRKDGIPYQMRMPI